jgi:hypothetical protein
MFDTIIHYICTQRSKHIPPSSPFSSIECVRVQCSTNIEEMRVTDKNQPITREVMNMGGLMFNTVHTYPMIQTYPLPHPHSPLLSVACSVPQILKCYLRVSHNLRFTPETMAIGLLYVSYNTYVPKMIQDKDTNPPSFPFPSPHPPHPPPQQTSQTTGVDG